MKKSIALIVFLFSLMNVKAQCNVVICNVNINYSLDSNGEGVLYADIVDAGSYSNCDLEVALYDLNNSVELVPFGDTISVSCDHEGQLTYRLRDVGTQNMCWGSIEIFDMQNACISSTDNVDTSLASTFNNGILNIELPAGIETELHIYNVVGKQILSKKINHLNSSIDMTTLEQKGIYIVSAVINKKLRSKKIVVW